MASAFEKSRFTTSGEVFVVVTGGSLAFRRSGPRGAAVALRTPTWSQTSYTAGPVYVHSSGQPGRPTPRLATLLEIKLDDLGMDEVMPAEMYVPDFTNLKVNVQNAELINARLRALEIKVPEYGSLTVGRSLARGATVAVDRYGSVRGGSRGGEWTATNNSEFQRFTTLSSDGAEFSDTPVLGPDLDVVSEAANLRQWWSLEAAAQPQALPARELGFLGLPSPGLVGVTG